MSSRTSSISAFPGRTALWAAALAAALVAAPAAGQDGEGDREGLRLTGRVVEALTGEPLAGATVVVEPETLGAFPGTAAGSGFVAAARSTETDPAGRYAFDRMAPGPYRVYVARYGYRPFSVTVELGLSGAGVSVALEADPIALEPVRGRGFGAGPYVAADAFDPAAELEAARLLVADLRRGRFLSTDVRELTHADVIEGVTLGDPDLFRALQRLPGVTSRSDYAAALWTRGAPWSQTRVYYDGVPLFNPLHALGMISGIGSNAVGSVWFHPGVRSAGMGDGAAGVVDLRSRGATGLGELNVQADASLATAGLAVDQRVLEGRVGWMLSGRTSYMDWLADLARRAAGQDGAVFPYHFKETAGRVDALLPRGHVVEVSWLWEGDELSSGPVTDADPLVASWGNTMGRATWSTGLGALRVQHTVGASRHNGLVRVDPARAELQNADLLRRSETRVDYLGFRGAIWPDDGGASGPRWTAGYEVALHGVGYQGPVPLPVPRAEALTVPAGIATVDDLNGIYVEDLGQWTSWDATLPVVGVWGERTWALGEDVALRAGLRLETGDRMRDAASVRFAPRVTLRYNPAQELSLSAGVARVHQYAQTVAPGGVHLASLVSTDAWLLAGPGVPAIRSDLATAGLELRPAAGTVATLNTFVRFAQGVVVPNPEPGPVLDRWPSLFTGRNTAVGLEASVRQLTGPITGSVAYSLTRSRIAVEGRTFPSAADRTHVLNATGMVRPLPGLRVGAAFTAATGVPFTRSISDSTACAGEPGCDPASLPWAGEPNSNRAPPFASLDLLVDWSTEVAGLNVGVYGQLRNVLGRENATVYTGGSGCLMVGCSIHELRNAYEEGVPRLPVIGIRVQH